MGLAVETARLVLGWPSSWSWRDPLSDDMDDILDGDRSRLEARFRELELQAEVERMRREQGGAPSGGAGSSAGRSSARSTASDDADPLADMKAALGDDKKATSSAPKSEPGAEVERYVLAICPHCDAKNRISLTRLRSANPRCGGCKQPLSFT